MRIRLLGGVRAATDAGDPIDVGSAKCQSVLAALSLSAGDPVPVARLIDAVWDEQPPPTADKTLQGYVARLRKALGHDAIARVGDAYRLDVGRDAVDVVRFRRHLGAGHVEAALAEWTGAPLAGLAVPALRPAVDGLVEEWLGAVEDDLARRLTGDAPGTLGTLTQLTREHPFRERLWALLMTALYRSGRQGDALAAFQQARHHLVEELGVEPGSGLRELEAAILDHDDGVLGPQPPGPAAGLQAGDDPPPRTALAWRGNLPRRLDPVVGRDAEIDTVVRIMAASPVTTLVGVGGIGKTTLGVAAARRWEAEYSSRAWLVDLTELTGPDEVPRAVAGTLGITERPGRSLTDSVVAVLRSHPTLLVLDNCEHVAAGAAALTRAVVEQCPTARVLATSRERLEAPGEQVVAVAPLDPAGAAVELFVARANAISWALDLETSRGEIEQICRRLDGVPLAIELAAARTASMSPVELLARLDDRLGLLTRGSRTGAERHRTLRAAVQWSFDLLTPAQRVLFARLSVFPGAFDLAAAEAVAGDSDPDHALESGTVARHLGDLVDRSMVAVEPGPSGRRFRLLETLRHYAAERLAANGESDAIAQRHVVWCRDRIHDIHGLLAGPDEAEGVVRLGELWPSLRAAVDRACTAGDVALADALVRPVAPEVNLRRRAEIGDWAERILALTPAADSARAMFWLLWAADRRLQAENHEACEALVQRHGVPDHPVVRHVRASLQVDGEQLCTWSPAAVAWLRELGEHHAAALVEITGPASGLLTMGRSRELEALATAMTDRRRAEGPPTLLYFALGLLGYAAELQGRREDANRFFAEAAGIRVPDGTYLVNQPIEARALFEQGERSRAFRLLRDHVASLLDTDSTDVARMVAIQYINLMAAIDRLPEGARALAYLDTTGDFGALARETLVADAARRIGVDPGGAGDGAPDSRQALSDMHAVLDELAEDR